MIELTVNINNLTKDVSNAVYHLKVTGVNLVICVLEANLVELVFQAAARYQLLDFSVVWMTFQLDGAMMHVHGKRLPWQWVDLRHQEPSQMATSNSVEDNFGFMRSMISKGISKNVM